MLKKGYTYILVKFYLKGENKSVFEKEMNEEEIVDLLNSHILKVREASFCEDGFFKIEKSVFQMMDNTFQMLVG
ncbi:hypothetical protein ACFOU2_21355 [Bacillus songklensis]|uniref:Uncharacterized protein n=1 Tax=Bacillus songklensis TaxID=1069116 RepID=A0ABV8B9S4_9BACI